MSYDFDLAPDRLPPVLTICPAQPDDLEAIVTLLQLAAIALTPKEGTTFTAGDLFREACALGGEEINLDAGDVMIVLHTGCPGIARAGRRRFRLE